MIAQIQRLLFIALIVNALTILVFIVGVSNGAFELILQKEPTAFQDFFKYYACGEMVLSQPGQNPYAPELQTRVLKEITSSVCVKGGANKNELPSQYLYPTDYPPFVYPIMAPLALLAPQQGLACWWLLSFSMLIGATFISTEQNKMRTALIVLGTLACVEAWRAVGMGQTTFFILSFLYLFTFSFLKNNDIACSIALVFTMLKVQYAPFLLVPLLARKCWRILLIAGLLLFFSIVFTGLVMGPAIFSNYFSSLGQIESGDPFMSSMICAKGILSYFLSGQILTMVVLGILILALVILWLFWTKANTPEKQAWTFALTICFALLASPHTQSYDVILLSAAAILTLPRGNLIGNRNISPINIWTNMIIAFPIVSVFLSRTNYFWHALGSIVYLGLLSHIAIRQLKTLARMPENVPKQISVQT